MQVFQWLEQPYELEQSAILQNRLVQQREELVRLWKDAHQRQEYDQAVLEQRMGSYEDVLQVLFLLLSFHYRKFQQSNSRAVE